MVDASRPNVTSAYALLLAHPVPETTTSGDFGNRRAVLKNGTGTAPIMLGGPDTASNARFPWDPADGSLSVEIEPGEQLWASAATTQAVYVLENGR